VGRTISKKVRKETWGKGVVKELAVYILENVPETKGLQRCGLLSAYQINLQQLHSS